MTSPDPMRYRKRDITASDVLEITASTESISALSRRYGLTKTTISDIRKVRTHREVLRNPAPDTRFRGEISEYHLNNYAPVPEAGCWIWLGGVMTSVGYGKINKADGRTLGAHRVFYQHHVGPIPDGMLVCHKCDTRLCVNPDHLFLGTVMDNNHDMFRKGRHPIIRPNARLSATQPLTPTNED